MITTVTVNYKTADYVERMLASLFAHHKAEDVQVIVVENGSGDDLSKLERQFPQVDFIYSDTNLGFAGGCNLGIKEAKGDPIILVNPDIIFDSDALVQIARKLNQDPDVGIGGISLKNLDGTQQDCVWRFPRPLDQLMVLLKIPHIVGDRGPVARWKMKGFDYTKTTDVDQVMGAFFAIRKRVIEDIGLLDDGFFIWYEEVDFCRRAKDAGWKVRYYADISARHKKGSSFDRVATIEKQAVVRKSLRRYMTKHHGLAGKMLFTFGEPLFWLMARIAAFIKPM